MHVGVGEVDTPSLVQVGKSSCNCLHSFRYLNESGVSEAVCVRWADLYWADMVKDQGEPQNRPLFHNYLPFYPWETRWHWDFL